VLAAGLIRDDLQAHLALARVGEQPPASTPTSLPVRTTRDSHEPAMGGRRRFRFEPTEREPTSGSRFDRPRPAGRRPCSRSASRGATQSGLTARSRMTGSGTEAAMSFGPGEDPTGTSPIDPARGALVGPREIAVRGVGEEACDLSSRVARRCD